MRILRHSRSLDAQDVLMQTLPHTRAFLVCLGLSPCGVSGLVLFPQESPSSGKLNW
ncbi:hypothetical protein GCM10007971_24760 [Oceanobacillus indicireducens]|uniref:Uncharacterized protein n=1 Tax=Oceanobacillus indicireducens TaxID=1004261 RepID=A0A918D2Y5_9BACI|nr:hypothetical protein GCM10007971_24760 [Oceanobacillus indicireducens]